MTIVGDRVLNGRIPGRGAFGWPAGALSGVRPAREDHRLDAQQLRQRLTATAGQTTLTAGADRRDNPCGRGSQGTRIRHERRHGEVSAQEQVAARPVIIGREPELRRVGCGLVQVVIGERALAHHELDELRHRGAKPLTLIGVDDVGVHLDRHLTVLERSHQWRLMGDEDADVLGMGDDPVQRTHRSVARPERIHGC